jgi:hypothetical protein
VVLEKGKETKRELGYKTLDELRNWIK